MGKNNFIDVLNDLQATFHRESLKEKLNISE